MKNKFLCLLLTLTFLLAALSGCARPEETVIVDGLMYDTYEEFEANSVHLHPETDANLRYAVYNNFAQIIECISDEPNIVIPDEYAGVPVVGIRDSAFYGNENLKHLTIGKNILKIGNSAFANCTSLTQVKMSNSVNDIQASAFANCSSLTSIVIPPKVTTIYSGTFSGCTSLQKVVVESYEMSTDAQDEGTRGSTTTEVARVIQAGTFSNCDSLAIMWIPEDIAEVQNSILGGSTPNPLICGGDATASSWFATLQCLDYELVARDDFNTHARLYTESLSANKHEAGDMISSGIFNISLEDVKYYNTLGSYTAGDNHILLAATFRIYNTTQISQYFDGLNVSCISNGPGKDGMTSDFVKYPLMISSKTLDMSYPVGDIAAGSYIEGVIVLRVSDRYETAKILFDGADEAFVI